MTLGLSLATDGSGWLSGHFLDVAGVVGWTAYSFSMVHRGNRLVECGQITPSERIRFVLGTTLIAVGFTLTFPLIRTGEGASLISVECRVLGLPPETLVGAGYWALWLGASLLWLGWLLRSGSRTLGRLWPMVRLPWSPARDTPVPAGQVRWVGVAGVIFWMTFQAFLGLSCSR